MSGEARGDLPATNPAPPAPGSARPRPRRRLRTKLAVALLSLFLPLALVETVARIRTQDPLDQQKITQFDPGDRSLGDKAFYESLAYPTAENPWYGVFRVDPQLGFGLEPDVALVLSFSEAAARSYHVRTNALGLRDDRPLASKKPGTFRVLALGDSMTYGMGVEREAAFPALLESQLAKRLAPREVEVVNAGVPCWGQWEETAFLEHRAGALTPDLVLLQFTVANDVLDDLRYRDEGGKLVPDPALGRELAESRLFHNPLADWSRAYRNFVWNSGRHILRYRAMLDPARLARASELIRRARDDAKKLGADFALVVAPPKFQVDGGLEETVTGSRGIDTAIVAQAERDGIAALDLGDALRQAKRRGESAYFAVDMHWTPDGHQVVADAVSSWLERLRKP